ncbi:MAG: hypothetical protein PHP50_09920 [Lachnospiraceae bacterium]|nr:hypothetical protein [Lachnospiraceae bacterium]
MKKLISRLGWIDTICFLLCLLLALLMLALYPCKLIGHGYFYHTSADNPFTLSDPLSDRAVTGIFTPSGNVLHSLGFQFALDQDVVRNMDSDERAMVSLTLLDENGDSVYESSTALQDLQNHKFYEFEIDVPVITGQSYTFYLDAKNAGTTALYLAYPKSQPAEFQFACYQDNPGAVIYPVLSVGYRDRLDLAQSLPWEILSLCMMALILTARTHFVHKEDVNS